MPLVPSPGVVRAADLLSRLAAAPTRSFTVTDLAREIGIPRATCDSLLLGLAQSGLVRRDLERRYQLGPTCIALGDAARTANPALRAAGVHASALARAHACVVAVTLRDGDETRVASVFDFGPPIGVRTRAGDAIRLVPPFGASFVAWDDDGQIDDWLHRAEPPLTAGESRRYRSALDAVRRRGYSITVATRRQPDLASALERLGGDPTAEDARRMRDEAIRTISHSEYLASDIESAETIQLTQISAPVFQSGATVGACIMLLGPSHELTATEIGTLGELVRGAAARATSDIGGSG